MRVLILCACVALVSAYGSSSLSSFQSSQFQPAVRQSSSFSSFSSRTSSGSSSGNFGSSGSYQQVQRNPPPPPPPVQPAYGSFQSQPPQPVPLPKTNSYGSPPQPQLPVDCSQKEDGPVSNPLEQCSDKFYFCANGLTFEMQCPGNLMYDYSQEMCESMAYNMACGGQPRPPTTPAPQRNPIPTPAPEVDCKRRENGPVADPRNKCSERYFVCSNGITTELECPAGMKFDIEAGACERFTNVYACSHKRPVPTQQIPTTPGPTLPPVPIDCESLGNGDFPATAASQLPVFQPGSYGAYQQQQQGNCQSFYYTCNHGFGWKRECPPGTYFSEQEKVCDSFEVACLGKPRPTQAAPSTGYGGSIVTCTLDQDLSPSYGVSIERTIQVSITGQLHLQASAITSVKIVSSRTIQIMCGNNAAQALQQSMNQGYLNIPNGQGGYVRIISIQISQGSGGSAPRPQYPFDCSTKDDGNYAAGSCQDYFWVCSGGETTKQDCAADTAFDSEYQECGNKEEVPECGGQRTTPPQFQPTAPPPPPPPFDCMRQPDGNYESGPCGNTFYTCSGGQAHEFTCPGSTVFNPQKGEKGECEIRRSVPSCPEYRPPTVAPPTYGQRPQFQPPAPVQPPRYGQPPRPVQPIAPPRPVQPVQRQPSQGYQSFGSGSSSGFSGSQSSSGFSQFQPSGSQSQQTRTIQRTIQFEAPVSRRVTTYQFDVPQNTGYQG